MPEELGSDFSTIDQLVGLGLLFYIIYLPRGLSDLHPHWTLEKRMSYNPLSLLPRFIRWDIPQPTAYRQIKVINLDRVPGIYDTKEGLSLCTGKDGLTGVGILADSAPIPVTHREGRKFNVDVLTGCPL